MTRIKLIFLTLWVGLTLLWIAADPISTGAHPFAQTRVSLLFYTGIMGIAMMSVSMMLSLRSVAVEPYVGGLDKSYRLHKWLGIGGLMMALAHWAFISGTSVFVALHLMPQPGRRPPGPPLHGIAATLATVKDPAIGIGAWCLYATIALIVLALVRWFPYRWFLKTHWLFTIVYLALVFHSVVLLKFDYWSHAVAWTLMALMVGGTASAFIVLFRKGGRTRQAVGEIDKVTSHGNVLEVGVCLKDRWTGHEPGQFAFVTFDAREGPHPFTISSMWKDDGHLVFLIKGLGDYTKTLPEKLKVGTLVTIEGPYGRFNFSGKRDRQIWVSGGIGITPFVSRMEALAGHPDGKIVDLFHSTTSRTMEPIHQLRALADRANVRLHVWVAAEDGRLTAERIRAEVPEWKSADVWFCGPIKFGNDLRKQFFADGLPSTAFHQELFHLR